MLGYYHLILGILGSAIVGCLIALLQESKPPKAVAVLTFLASALIFSGIFGFYLGLEEAERNHSILNSPMSESSSSPAPRMSPAPATPANTPTNIKASPRAVYNEDQAKSDVSDSIDSWKSLAEEHNFNSYMDSYADQVDYYLTENASRDFVRRDRLKAFQRYNSMRIDITNMRVSFDGREKATAIFDKDWEFSGPQKYWRGKVNQQLQLEKINGQWRITGEKDLKVYY